MAAQLVARLGNPGCHIRILPNPVAAEEEGGLHAPFLQAVQQGGGKPAGGAVIKGQGNRGSLRPGRHGKAEAQQSETQQFSQEKPSFLGKIGFDGSGNLGYDKG